MPDPLESKSIVLGVTGSIACHKAVDRLKETVPIWKKEVYEDGSRWVACEDHEFTPTHEATLPASGG